MKIGKKLLAVVLSGAMAVQFVPTASANKNLLSLHTLHTLNRAGMSGSELMRFCNSGTFRLRVKKVLDISKRLIELAIQNLDDEEDKIFLAENIASYFLCIFKKVFEPALKQGFDLSKLGLDYVIERLQNPYLSLESKLEDLNRFGRSLDVRLRKGKTITRILEKYTKTHTRFYMSSEIFICSILEDLVATSDTGNLLNSANDSDSESDVSDLRVSPPLEADEEDLPEVKDSSESGEKSVVEIKDIDDADEEDLPEVKDSSEFGEKSGVEIEDIDDADEEDSSEVEDSSESGEKSGVEIKDIDDVAKKDSSEVKDSSESGEKSGVEIEDIDDADEEDSSEVEDSSESGEKSGVEIKDIDDADEEDSSEVEDSSESGSGEKSDNIIVKFLRFISGGLLFRKK